MIHYNRLRKDISSFSDIDDTNNYYYKYKSIDFLYKKYDNSERLLICFHGARCKATLPIFRGYNWNYNILSISDKVLELHEELELAWYLTPDNQTIYKEIIAFFVEKYKNCVFFGSSGGGYPALLYASIFHKKAFIQNSQLYIHKYHYRKNLCKIYSDIEMGDYDIEESIAKYGLPEKAYIYVNERDSDHYNNHFLSFKTFILSNKFNAHFMFHSFVGEEPVPPQNHHHVQLPVGLSLHTIISDIFNEL
jgi:hypothetical protein